jgi:lactose/L-arabinose transport system ATP-binding protein
MNAIELKAVKKSFGMVDVIHGIDLSVKPGEFCVFVGPSGCGKSTLLRMIAGLEDISGGDVRIDGKVVNNLEPGDRELAMVFQSYALYPHMTVAGNMGFGLRMNGMPKAEVERRVREAAAILQLDALMQRRPAQLSGGQRQRVAIGRAIVRQPKAFLFDEPLSNLDAELRVQMRVEIAKLHQELGATMIYVTHDQVEAMTLADRIVVLRAGTVEQVGRPVDLYRDPNNMFVAGFIGSPKMNFLTGTVRSGGEVTVAGTTLKPVLSTPLPEGWTVKIGVRPEQFERAGVQAIQLQLQVEVIENLGGTSILHGRVLTGEKLLVELRGYHEIRAGESVTVSFSANDILVFAEDETRLR